MDRRGQLSKTPSELTCLLQMSTSKIEMGIRKVLHTGDLHD